MKDSQVDLCGEIGCVDDDSFPVLDAEDSFEFACSGCGDCCRGREDIVLSGYDLYRICARLRLPPAVVIRGYCRQYTGKNSRLPVVRLQPLAAERGNCPFLYKSRCSIHDAEPLVCALYPLGQQIGLDGLVTYFAQPTDCGGQIVRAKCSDHLELYGIREREPVDVRWALGCIRLSKRVRALEPSLVPAQRGMVQYKIRQALYLSLDWEQPYLPQLEQALCKLDAYLDKVAARTAETL